MSRRNGAGEESGATVEHGNYEQEQGSRRRSRTTGEYRSTSRSRADMEKDNFLTEAMFDPKLFYPKKCVNFDKSEFATKQRKCT